MIRAHLSYLKYVLRHKWFVFRECQRVGITWRGIVHDMSKFSRAEWEPYVCVFYNPDGSRRDVRDATGHYDPTTLGKARIAASTGNRARRFASDGGRSSRERATYSV